MSCHPGRDSYVHRFWGWDVGPLLGRGFILSTPQGLFQQQTGLGNMTSQSLLLQPPLARRAAAPFLPSPTPAPLPLPLLPSLLPTPLFLLPSSPPPPHSRPRPSEAGAGVLREVKLGIPSPSFRSPGEQERTVTAWGLPMSKWWGQWGEKVWLDPELHLSF